MQSHQEMAAFYPARLREAMSQAGFWASAYRHGSLDSGCRHGRPMATFADGARGAVLGRSDSADAAELVRLFGRLSIESRNRCLGVREYERSPA